MDVQHPGMCGCCGNIALSAAEHPGIPPNSSLGHHLIPVFVFLFWLLLQT